MIAITLWMVLLLIIFIEFWDNILRWVATMKVSCIYTGQTYQMSCSAILYDVGELFIGILKSFNNIISSNKNSLSFNLSHAIDSHRFSQWGLLGPVSV